MKRRLEENGEEKGRGEDEDEEYPLYFNESSFAFYTEQEKKLSCKRKDKTPKIQEKQEQKSRLLENPELRKAIKEYGGRLYLGPYKHNIVTKGTITTNLEQLPREYMALLTTGNHSNSDHASPMSVINSEQKCTARIFPYEKFISAGSSDETMAAASILTLAAHCSRQLKCVIQPTRMIVTNILFTAYMNYELDLNQVFARLDAAGYTVNYTHSVFPAVRYKNKVSISIFSTGAINITGGKTREDVIRAIDEIAPLLKECATREINQLEEKHAKWALHMKEMTDKRRKTTPYSLGGQRLFPTSLYYTTQAKGGMKSFALLTE